MRGRYQKLKEPSLASRSEVYEQFVNSLLLFIGIVILHSIAMIIFEGLSLKDSLWLTLTSITTVGYGDLSAKTDAGRASTIILIYVGGIALLAKLVAEYVDFRLERRDRKIKGLWEWTSMKDHLLIINTPEQDTQRYLTRLIEQIRLTPNLADLPVQIVSDHFEEGLPVEVRDAGVVHTHGRAEGANILDNLNIKHAKYIIIIARNFSDSISDSINFDILHRIAEFNSTAYILAEVVDDNNRKRFTEHGADSVVRPIRAYPEIMTRALEAPGTEQVLENLFTHKGDYPRRFEVMIRNMRWDEVVAKIVAAGIGTPLGYIDENKKAHTNPLPEKQVHTDSIIVLVNEAKKVTDEDASRALRTSPKS
jgi:voltage-gated potassium channel